MHTHSAIVQSISSTHANNAMLPAPCCATLHRAVLRCAVLCHAALHHATLDQTSKAASDQQTLKFVRSNLLHFLLS
jgi:hypothetical protein